MTTVTHRCEGCGYPFTSAPGERYCSSTCAGSAAMTEVIAAIRRFSESSRR